MVSGPFEFAEMPEEAQQQIQAMMSQHRAHAEYHAMATDSVVHGVHQLVNSFNEDELRAFTVLMNSMGKRGSYWVGVASAYLELKHEVCPACSRKHDEELEKLAGDGSQETDWPTFVANLPDEVPKQMMEYRLNYMPGEWPKVMCRDCGQVYPSLKDRMKRAPDFCPGCHDKSAHG